MTDLRARLQSALGDAYSVDRELGGGGMSRVFVAQDATLGRSVVVKLLSPDLSAGVNLERFNREILLAARLQHACIVPVLAAGDAGGIPYYTMPLVTGESLRARIDREGRLPINDVVRILRDVAEALSYAHEQGVVHRDIKPDNVLITRHHALVTDFGVAKALGAATNPDASTITGLGSVIGTPAYMAPEQASGDPETDHRADLYALGALGYELLTGRRLFAGLSPQQSIVAHVTKEPDDVRKLRPDTPRALGDLVMRLLAKSPADRPQTSDHVLRALDAVGASSGSTAATSRWRGTRPRIAAGAVLLLVLGGSAVLAFRVRGRRSAPRQSSVAVLPFTNLSGDPQNDYLGDGLSEQLIDALSRVKTLRVAARTSSFAFRGRSEDIRAIASQLGVSTILAGSVRRSGNHLRVTAQFTSADNGFNIWSQTFDRDFTDVLAVQDEIGRAIVSALTGTLVPTDGVMVRAALSTNVEAYDAYLKGLYYWNRRGRDGIASAAKYFREAVAKDTAFAAAYAFLANTFLQSANWSFLPTRVGTDSARLYALRALAIDPRSAEGHTALGSILCRQDWEFANGEREFRRAMELNPADPVTPYFYSWCVAPLGRFDDAMAFAQRAHELDRLNAQIYSAVGRVYYLQRRYREGLDAYRAVEGMPEAAATHYWKSQFHSALGEIREATEEGKRGAETSGGSPLYLTVYAQALYAAGQRDSARAIIQRLERLAGRPSYGIAQYYALAGDEPRTLAWLDTAYTDRSDWLTSVALDKDFDRYRDNPRIIALLKKLKLTEVSKASK